MKTVKFKFDIKEKVKILGDVKGIIRGLGYDERGNQYDVVTTHGQAWWREDEIKRIDADS